MRDDLAQDARNEGRHGERRAPSGRGSACKLDRGFQLPIFITRQSGVHVFQKVAPVNKDVHARTRIKEITSFEFAVAGYRYPPVNP